MADRPVYHYTSVQVLFEIVRSRRFRLSNVFFMNDYMEVEWLFSLADKRMEERKAESFDNLQTFTRERGFDHVFCGCFSRLKDDLSQWRGYADDGRGVCVGVDLERVTQANQKTLLRIEEVEYDQDVQRRKVDDILDEFQRELSGRNPRHAGARSFFCLGRLANSSKNPAFCKEQEVRLVLAPAQWPTRPKWIYKDHHLESLPHGIDFCTRRGRIVPYAEITFPVEAIRRILLGPRFGTPMEERGLQLFLSKSGLHERTVRNIKRSEASYH